ncbi:hypothetical protein HRbin12_00196 [bacterium HR12]|nr:hypothetical protein HRbin12_00196 [bacterium HR12]GIU98843.1 MAG: hypothetical protein KatS3mg014_0459 [Actinomycetota bacterium]
MSNLKTRVPPSAFHHGGVATIRIRRRGAAGKYQIWARARNPERWPEWAPLRGVLADGPLRPGLEGELVLALGLRVRFEVLEADQEPGGFTWVLGSGWARLRIEQEVAEGLAGAVLSGSAPIVLLAAPVAGAALARLVAPARPISGSRPRRARRSAS